MALFLARLRTLFAVLFTRRPRLSTPAFHRLLERAGIPRSVTPELLEVTRLAGLRLDGEGGGGDDGGDDDSGDDDGDDDAGDDDSGDDESEKTAEDYRKELRKSERRWKRTGAKNKDELAKLRKQLKEREDEDKSEQEKAVQKAKEEGRTEALSEAEKKSRTDRLESACVRQAAKKIEIGEGEDKKKVRFEDPEDAEVFLQRKIAKGDLDEADLFDEDGKVKTDALAEALQEILEERPRLAEESGSGSDEGKKKIPEGSADGRKGKEPKGEPSVADLVKKKEQG